MTIWLLRHGESVGNRDGLFSGVHDHPLTQLGRQQARLAGEGFGGRDFDRVYTSGLGRAIETADIFLAASGARVGAREVRTELNERNFGDYEARPQPPPHQLVEGDIAWRICRDVAFVPPGGESMLQTHARAVAFLEMARQDPGETLIVAHGNILRSMALHHLGWPPELLPDMPSRNCLITRIAC
jgi:2,3-bisphosphoglycerate-dependent phosphoglycerate mutase